MTYPPYMADAQDGAPSCVVIVLERRELVRSALVDVLSADGTLDVRVATGEAQALALGAGSAGDPVYLATERAPGMNRWFSPEPFDLSDGTRLRAEVHKAPVLPPVSGTGPGVRRPLTAHELSVLRCIASGMTAGVAAESLGVSRKSVESAKRRIFDKLGARNQAEAVALAGVAIAAQSRSRL